MNLTTMNLVELRGLEEQIRREIRKREAEDIVRAREEILSIAQRLGVPLKDILGAQGKAKPVKGTGGFQHPENAALTWSGRGRQPGWIKAWLAAGQSIDALRI